MSTLTRRRRPAAEHPLPAPARRPSRLDVWFDAHSRAVTVALYLTALGLRLLYLAGFRHTLLAHVPLLDEAFYRAEAWNIVRGAPPASDAYFMTPLYPLFLSVVFRLVGDGPTGPFAVQLALGALVAPITWRIARRALPATLAVVAALAIASFAPLVFFEALFLVEGLVLLALGSALLLAVRGPQSLRHALLSGACLGIAVMGRGSNLVLAAPLAAWFLLHRGGRRPGDGRRALRRMVLFGLACGIVLAPLLVRNAVRAGRPLLLTANAGLNLYIGNGPEATGIFVRLSGLDPLQDPMTLRHVQRQLHRPVTASQTSDYWTRRCLEHVRRHPGRTLQLFVWKLMLFWNRLSIPQVEGFESSVRGTALASLPFWRDFSLFPLGLFGAMASLLALLRRRSADAGPESREPPVPGHGFAQPGAVLALLAACTLLYSFSIALFFITDRYRVAVLPWLVVLALHALQIVGRAARVKPRALLALAPLLGLCFWFTSPARVPIDVRRMRRDLHVHTALRYAEAGRFSQALQEYEGALRLDPSDAETRDGYARVLGRAGSDSLAIEQLESILRERPDYANSWYNLGNAYRRSHRLEQAAAAYDRALRLDPQRDAAWNNLGRVRWALGDTARAAAAFQQALLVVPNQEKALNNLGALRGAQGDARGAEAGFRAAIAASPRYVPALRNLAILLTNTERPAEAAGLWRRILGLDPGNELAARMLGETSPPPRSVSVRRPPSSPGADKEDD